MNSKQIFNIILLVFGFILFVKCNELKKPSVVIILLVRNKAHTLPYFLTYLENLSYPKERITLW